jgi:ferric enterobactin receptor
MPLSLRFLIFLIGFTETTLYTQNLLSGNFQQTPLPEALKSLEQSGGLNISFDPVSAKNIRVTARFRDQKPVDAFEMLLRETPFVADFPRERYVIIRKRGESAPAPEPITLCGRIIDAETHEGLPYVTIQIPSRSQGIQTDLSGSFSLQIAAPLGDRDSVYLRYIGYQFRQIAAKTLAKTPCPELPMRLNTRALMEIVIMDRAVDPIGVPVKGEAPTELRPDRTGFVPPLGEPDPFRMIQMLPGVTSDGDKAGELLVRGGSSDQNMVLWEGIPIYHTGHLFGVVSALNPYVVNRVTVWKGNFGAEQGGRASCMIDMRCDPPTPNKATFAAGINFLSAYFAFETPLFKQKGGLLLAGRGAFSDLIQNKAYQKLFGFATQNSRIKDDVDTQQSDSFLLHAIRIQPVSEFNDANFKIYYQPTPKTRLEMSAYSGADALRYRVDANIPAWGFTYSGGDTVQVGNVGIGMRIRQNWSPTYHSEWQFAVSDYASLYDYAGSFDTTMFPQTKRRQENSLKETVFRFDNAWRLTPLQELKFGFQAVKTGNRFLERYTDYLSPDNSYEWKVDLPSNQSAFYGAWRAADGDLWSFEAGLRNVTFNYSTRSYWEPRVSAQWAVSESIRLKANAGVYRQFMRKAYIWNNLGLNNEVWFTADENLKLPVLVNRQFAVGMTVSKNGWLMDMEVYRKLLTPLTGVNLRFNGQPQTVSDARGKEQAVGLELLLRKRWGVYTHWISYTYGKAEARFDSLNAGAAFPTDFDQRHTISWTHSFDWKRWSLALSWNFHSGRPFTPAIGIDTILQPDGSQTQEVAYGPRNTARLPDYHRLDISTQYNFKIGKMKGGIGLSIYNFYNRANLQSRSFFVQQTADDNGEPQYAVGSFERTSLASIGNLFLLMRW